MIERRVKASEQDFLDEFSVLIKAETPTSALQLVAEHQLARNRMRMIDRMLTMGEPDIVRDQTFAVVQYKAVSGHFGSRAGRKITWARAPHRPELALSWRSRVSVCPSPVGYFCKTLGIEQGPEQTVLCGSGTDSS